MAATGQDGRHLYTYPLCEAMPHGWGHGKPGTRLSVANGTMGMNTNILSPLNRIPVAVSSAEA